MVDLISNKIYETYNRFSPSNNHQNDTLASLNTLKRHSTDARYRNRLIKEADREIKESQLYHLKEAVPDLNVTLRPTFVGLCCQNCSLTSRESLVKRTTEQLSLINILNYSPPISRNGLVTRAFSHLHQVWELRRYRYPQVSHLVLKDDRVIKAIEKTAIQQFQASDNSEDEFYMQLMKKNQKRAQNLLLGMRSTLSDFLLRFTSWILYKLLPCFLGSVIVHPGQVEMLKEASKSNLPLIFLPLHRSHLDYILISFILLNNNIRSPLVAAGDNLRIPFFGSLLRGLGAFFIRRRLHPTPEGGKDYVYKAVLHTYMNLCLKAGHNIEFFLEGGRTRTGKPCMPKYGVLSVIVESFLDGTVEDALLVPVSVNYEKLVDGNFITEQLGQPKKMETFGQTLKGIWGVLNSNYGMMRIDFNQPFSLRELISSINTSSKPDKPSIQNRVLKSNPSTNSLYGTDIISDEHKNLVENVSKHVIFDCSQATTVMSTNALAFLLLTKYRNGVSLQDLAVALEELRKELIYSRRNVGFTGDPVDVINYAIYILGPGLIKREKQKTEDIIKPVAILPNVIELSYYSNTVVGHFAIESVVAISLSVTEMRLSTVSHDDLLENALGLCDIFQYEFLFCKPCQVLEQVVTGAIDDLASRKEIFLVEDESELVQRSKRIASQFEDENEEEENERFFQKLYKLNATKETVDFLKDLRNILLPLVETYAVTAFVLDKLVQRQLLENELVEEVLIELKNQLSRGSIDYDESVSVDPIKNALKLFQKWDVLECHNEGKLRLYYLKENFDSSEAVREVYNKVNKYRNFLL